MVPVIYTYADSMLAGMERQDGQNSGFPELQTSQDGILKKPWQQQLRPFQLAAVDQTERLWQVSALIPMFNTATCQYCGNAYGACATSATITGYAQYCLHVEHC